MKTTKTPSDYDDCPLWLIASILVALFVVIWLSHVDFAAGRANAHAKKKAMDDFRYTQAITAKYNK